MAEFLTFALAAPLAAMGAVAVGERREGWSRPARSAILGLIAGCLGLERENEDAHAALEAELGLALLLEGAGRQLQDYHTTQVPPARRGRRFATRAAELAVPKEELNTILTRRDYRQDVLCLGVLWVRDGHDRSWTLLELAAAMERPCFTPYFGRKSCPLGLPLAPRVRQAADPAAALAWRRQDGPETRLRASPGGDRWLPLADPATVALSVTDAQAFRLGGSRHEWRRDAIASRRRWQFALREEILIPLPLTSETMP